jgi:hypothetical protein
MDLKMDQYQKLLKSIAFEGEYDGFKRLSIQERHRKSNNKSIKHESVETLYCHIQAKSFNAGLEETLLHSKRVLIGEYGIRVTFF